MTNDHSNRAMSAEAVVRALYDRVAAADFGAVLQLLDENVEFVQAAGLPFGGRYVGKQAFGDMAARIFATWPGFAVRPLSFLTDGAELVTVVTELTGDTLQMPMVELWTVRGGLVVRCQPFYFDTANAVKTAA